MSLMDQAKSLVKSTASKLAVGALVLTPLGMANTPRASAAPLPEFGAPTAQAEVIEDNFVDPATVSPLNGDLQNGGSVLRLFGTDDLGGDQFISGTAYRARYRWSGSWIAAPVPGQYFDLDYEFTVDGGVDSDLNVDSSMGWELLVDLDADGTPEFTDSDTASGSNLPLDVNDSATFFTGDGVHNDYVIDLIIDATTSATAFHELTIPDNSIDLSGTEGVLPTPAAVLGGATLLAAVGIRRRRRRS